MDGKKGSVWMKRVTEKSLYPCPKQTRNKHQCVFPLPFCVQSITEKKKIIIIKVPAFQKQAPCLHIWNRSNSCQYNMTTVWDHEKVQRAFFLSCLSLLVVYNSCSVFRGWREGKRRGHHFGVHWSSSHVPLADAYPLHPQAEEGKVFLLRHYMRC